MSGSSGLTRVAWRSRTGGQSVWANRSHSAVIGPKSSTAVILLSLRRYPMPAWSICQPLPTVDGDLHLVGCPGLQPHVHPAELGIDPGATHEIIQPVE